MVYYIFSVGQYVGVDFVYALSSIYQSDEKTGTCMHMNTGTTIDIYWGYEYSMKLLVYV